VDCTFSESAGNLASVLGLENILKSLMYFILLNEFMELSNAVIGSKNSCMASDQLERIFYETPVEELWR
jgi:hypothetical protein